MDYNTFSHLVEGQEAAKAVTALSCYEAFATIKDGRKKRGGRYSVALILTLLMLGKLAAETTPGGIAQRVRLRAEQLAAEFGMDASKFATSRPVPISTNTLRPIGRASNKSFGSNASCRRRARHAAR